MRRGLVFRSAIRFFRRNQSVGEVMNESTPKRAEGQSAQGSSAAGWRESKWLALCELAIVVLVFIADWRHLIPFCKSPFFLLVGWISLISEEHTFELQLPI